MYYVFSLLTGILISVMIAFNGGLTERLGIYSATVIIHIAGLILITIIVLIRRDRFITLGHPWFLYLGGAFGVLTTVFNNLSFGRISVSAILALGLLGQSMAGLVIDQYGLFGLQKHPFTKGKLFGLILITGGIGSMINNFEIVAVIVSFAAGIIIVVSRTLNAKLSDLTNVRTSTFYNYAVGLVGSVLVFLILGREDMLLFTGFDGFNIFSSNWWIYLGGILGVCVVLLSNITALKISAFYLTLLIFIGQIFSGITIDVIITQQLSYRNLIGGVLVALGLCVNLFLDSRTQNHVGKKI